MRNVVLKWAERDDQNKQSEVAKHLKYFHDHQFEVLTRATEYMKKREILEAFLIKSINPSLKEKLEQNY